MSVRGASRMMWRAFHLPLFPWWNIYEWVVFLGHGQFRHHAPCHSSEPFGKSGLRKEGEVKWMDRKSALRDWEYACRSGPETSRVCVISSIISVSTTQINKQSHFLDFPDASQGKGNHCNYDPERGVPYSADWGRARGPWENASSWLPTRQCHHASKHSHYAWGLVCCT